MIDLPKIYVPDGLPTLAPSLQAHARKVNAMLAKNIGNAGGWLDFEQWMQAALYAPGLGYYSAGSTKFARAGDFTTAPEISPLFGQALARQIAEILQRSDSDQVLEFGAGSGALAASLIAALNKLGIDVNYRIIELSADLRQRQQKRLQQYGHQVQWLEHLPQKFSGCVLANEVLDAMPVKLVRLNAQLQPELLGVSMAAGHTYTDNSNTSPFTWASKPATEPLAGIIKQRLPAIAGYTSEINLQAQAWISSLGSWLQRGAALLIDYGFSQAEYYHPQRNTGTMMCHFRHFAHDQALILAGMQDITSHVDFTALADTALQADMQVLGYTSQARFLINCGLLQLLTEAADPGARASQLSAFNTLTSEAEMGELFKVIALGKNIDTGLCGFVSGDRRHRL